VAGLATASGLLPVPGLTPEAHRTLVIVVAAAGLWISEALPVAVTALTIPILALLLGAAPAKQAFAGFGDPIVFLFLGTFLLTEAAFQYGLTERLARSVLSARAMRERPGRLLWAIALLGCGISGWANNTATTAILLPLALTAERFAGPRLLTGILLLCAYAPSLGGIATPVGTAPNLIGLRLLEQHAGTRPSFATWCALFAPLAILSTAMVALALRVRAGASPPASAISKGREERSPWSRAEKTLVPVFAIVILLWIVPGILAATSLGKEEWVKMWQARLPEPAVPLLGGIVLFLLPRGRSPREGKGDGGGPILTVDVLRRLDWSTLLLFGGGLTLGSLMFESGLARAIGEALFAAMPIEGGFGIILAATILGVAVSELTTNTASASLVVPVVLALAEAAHVDPVGPALAATIACSFGFMLPVSTPPNALVFATGRVPLLEMVRVGFLLDLAGIGAVAGWVALWL
jgi:sodium-dependent dicarboxylate transporter 2/3/5